jgi:plastocyanin
MRRLSVLMLMLLFSSAVACNKEIADPESPTTATVIAGTNNQYQPLDQSIRLGGTVTWQFLAEHTVTFQAQAGAPDNIPRQVSGSAQRTFLTLGKYIYECDLHDNMQGTITVLAR